MPLLRLGTTEDMEAMVDMVEVMDIMERDLLMLRL